MNIYFSCSITGGRAYEPVYQAITRALAEDGHEVPTLHLADANVKALEAVASANEVYERDVAWMQACDAVVAEVSTPSHGVGYEIAYSLGIGKPVLCLYQEGQAVSKMITGNSDPRICVRSYGSTEDAIQVMRAFLSTL
jgi:2'-deoxynucleoside 5'-phosphate N-hydrolase